MKILLLDNYDSFTYNLLHYLEGLGAEVTVFRNDEIALEQVRIYDKIVLSPGPGIPEQAGVLKSLIREYANKKPILGICLGQQAIAEVFGGSIFRLENAVHGISTEIKVIDPNEILFKGLPKKLEVAKYHSWAVNPKDFPIKLEITSLDKTGTIMSLRHKTYDVRGVQFHPESIMTPQGFKMLENWVKD